MLRSGATHITCTPAGTERLTRLPTTRRSGLVQRRAAVSVLAGGLLRVCYVWTLRSRYTPLHSATLRSALTYHYATLHTLRQRHRRGVWQSLILLRNTIATTQADTTQYRYANTTQRTGILRLLLIIPILKNDVALPNFTKCGGIGHKLTVCATKD